jgi:predicted enzyme related to lactoylglutathione lyase
MTVKIGAVCYQEIVTPNALQLRKLFEHSFNWTFTTVDALGNAHVADLPEGGRIGIRQPMSDTEQAITRLYVLVDNLAESIKDVRDLGGVILLEKMELAGQGTIAIYEAGGIEHGLWQL